MQVNTENEALRASYRPERIRVLFVGESPPAGGTFFYAANSHLWRYTQQAFARTYGREWTSGPAFLSDFQALGCYLEDLCVEPVNHLDPVTRRQHWQASVPSLAERIALAKPLAILTIIRRIERSVTRAIQESGIAPVPTVFFPFPHMGNQQRYVTLLGEALDELRQNAILP